MIYGRFLVNPARVISVVCNAMNDKASPHLAWADFKIKVKRIAHSIVHFDQWNKLISKM